MKGRHPAPEPAQAQPPPSRCLPERPAKPLPQEASPDVSEQDLAWPQRPWSVYTVAGRGTLGHTIPSTLRQPPQEWGPPTRALPPAFPATSSTLSPGASVSGPGLIS